MKNIEIFEPAMCCPTGLCGVGVDPELLRISTVLNTLQQKGITVKRFNLTNAPMEFIKNRAVNDFIQLYGADKLPITVVDGELAVFCRYPTNSEFTKWLELSPDVLGISDAPCCCTTDSADCCEENTEAESCCCGDSSDDDTSASDCCCEGGCC